MRNKKNDSFSVVAKVSPIFVILIIIVVAAFAYAMINIGRLPSPQEKKEAFNQQMKDAMIAEEAQATGLSSEEVKRRWQERDERQRLMAKLNNGINQNNNNLVSESLRKLTTADFHENGGLVLRNAIVADNEGAFQLLLKKGIPCNNQSATGRNAFSAAILIAKSPSYIKILLDNNCGYEKNSKQPSMEDRIINSAYPIKLFLLPEKYIDTDYKDKAFLKAISRGMYEQVQAMLDLGANPNMPDALTTSLFSNSKISFLLINNGADITAKSTKGVHVLSTAFMKGKVDVAKEILRRYPDYIQREKIEHNILSYIFHLNKNPTSVRESITLLLDHGLEKTHLIKSYPWLRKAVNLPDYLLLDQLLDIGNQSYKQSTIEKALKYLESKNINSYHKNKMIKSLQKYNKHNKQG